MDDKKKIGFLDIVIPFTFIYTAFLCFKAYFIQGNPEGSFKDVVALSSIAIVFTYGVIALIVDLKHIGLQAVLKKWRHIYKKKVNK